MNARPYVLLACCVVALVLALSVALPRDEAARPGPPVGAPGPESATSEVISALAVLHAWDARRAAAWKAVDPAALRALYVAGSRTGRADVRMLRAYAARDVRVTGLRMQVTATHLARVRQRRVVLVVTERLARPSAWTEAGMTRLPADRLSRHLVALRRVAGRWLVDEVRGQARAEAITASTSGSAKP